MILNFMLLFEFAHKIVISANTVNKETIKVCTFPWKLNSRQRIPIIILFSWLLHYNRLKRQWEREREDDREEVKAMRKRAPKATTKFFLLFIWEWNALYFIYILKGWPVEPTKICSIWLTIYFAFKFFTLNWNWIQGLLITKILNLFFG